MKPADILLFVFVFMGAIIGTCLHEFGHALVAYYGGDVTVRDKGYLTLNPLKYTHPLYSILLPLVFLAIGGIPLPGGAVYIDHSRIRNKWWDSGLSLAGPAATLLFTLLLAIPFILGIAGKTGPLWIGWAFLVGAQVLAFFFNLLPIPPLDGYHTISPFLPREIRKTLDSFGHIGIFILFIVFFQIPSVNQAFWGVSYHMMDLLNVPPEQFREGFRAIRFWEN